MLSLHDFLPDFVEHLVEFLPLSSCLLLELLQMGPHHQNLMHELVLARNGIQAQRLKAVSLLLGALLNRKHVVVFVLLSQDAVNTQQFLALVAIDFNLLARVLGASFIARQCSACSCFEVALAMNVAKLVELQVKRRVVGQRVQSLIFLLSWM